MSRTGHITRAFGDGHYEFFLGIIQLDELDEKTGVGPGTLLRRIAAGDARSQDIRQTIRLALVGGESVKSGEAVKLVERYVDPPNAMFESMPLAIDILAAALYVPESRSKKKAAAIADETPTTDSTSSSSMETVQ